ncbi:hypothetical protein F7725_024393, partial [Dissostichus mawsoni]
MALEEMASCSSPETSAKANGLHGTFLKGNTVLGLLMAEDLMGDLEIQFYNALDTVNTQFIERFEQAGFHKLQQLENVLLHGDMDKVVEEYPELNSRLLQVQLAMFG